MRHYEADLTAGDGNAIGRVLVRAGNGSGSWAGSFAYDEAFEPQLTRPNPYILRLVGGPPLIVDVFLIGIADGPGTRRAIFSRGTELSDAWHESP